MSISRDDVLRAMSDHAFFGGLTGAQREDVIHRSRMQSAEKDEILFQTGDPYSGFYLLIDGTVQIYRLNESGRMLVLHVIEPGESFAEVPLFEPEGSDTYPATAQALTDCVLLFVPADAFRSFIEDNPSASLGMLGEMARRLREAVRQLDAVSLHDVKERLARHLWTEVQSHSPSGGSDTGSGGRYAAPVTVNLGTPKSVLAAELGTVPETLSRALRDLEEDGLIMRRGDRIDVTAPEELSRLGRSRA